MIKLSRTTALLCLSICAFWVNAQDPITTVEAEKGSFNGVQSATSNSGFSGEGYVTGFDNKSDYVEVQVAITQGDLYRLEIGYSSSGTKTQQIYINGDGPHPIVFESTGSGVWSSQKAGSYRFNSGRNTIRLQSDWGYMDVDNFVIYPIEEKTYDIATTPVDPQANDDAVALYDFMLEHFGKRVISGQTNDRYDELVSEAGYRPLMRVYDLKSYTQGYPYAWDNETASHTFGAVDDGQVDDAIAWHKETGGVGIVNWQWHWHSPSDGVPGENTFWTEETDFDVREAVKEGTEEYNLIIEDIDAIAVQLKKMSDAGVPIIWRPLHEAGGGWFWWGAHGPEPCLKLWDIVYDRLQNHHGIHNLIWSWSTPEHDWYPGNEKVDFIGYDSYPGDMNYVSQTQMYNQVYEITEGKKMIAMTENGPIPDLKTSFSLDAPWSMFMCWSELTFSQNSTQHLQEIYAYWRVLVFDSQYNLILREEEDETIEPQEPVLHSPSNLDMLVIYPNPAREQVQIKGLEYQSVALHDMTGRQVLAQQSTTQAIDISWLNPGQYLLLIRTDQAIVRRQLIINR
ncbi:glycosyl hydrolase [Reichenbachiella ulvae]|uniref:Glycosyl hydrolase n=1 Tax=Reichenbachiella ulvae TaxID=2980104 RepID=A0ABT3CTK3_9BACT|nr:glycosyl hydrolase [Reichenbachiella ulvae]MCV9387003.1 glycosyl hydrolase [Reichenbachiella ulvae]